MAITYKVTQCRNPKYPDADYFKGTAVKTSGYDFEELVDDKSDGRVVYIAKYHYLCHNITNK